MVFQYPTDWRKFLNLYQNIWRIAMGKYYKIPWLSDFYRLLNRLNHFWNSLFLHFKFITRVVSHLSPQKHNQKKLLWITHKENNEIKTKSCYLRILDNINILFVLYFDWKFEHGLVSIWCPAATFQKVLCVSSFILNRF